jgi:hypothetical protein
MQGVVKERWFELRALVAIEQEPAKLMALVQEINRLLAEKETRLKSLSATADQSSTK